MHYTRYMSRSVLARFDHFDKFLLSIVAIGLGWLAFSRLARPADAISQVSDVTVTLGSAIELDIQPVDPGVNDPAFIKTTPTTGYGYGSAIVTVSSNSYSGYSVRLQMQNDDKDLNYLVSSDVTDYTNGGTTLDTSHNVIAPLVPSGTLLPNTWGFAVASNPNIYHAVPLRTATGYNIVAEADTPNKGRTAGTDIITITFGVLIDFNLEASSGYKNTVLCTATNNPA